MSYFIVRDNRGVFRREVEDEVGKSASGKEVLDYLLGTESNGHNADSRILIKVWMDDDRTVIHRLNMFWVMPLTLLLSPVMYVLNGSVGWTTRTRFGRFVLRVTGHLKE